MAVEWSGMGRGKRGSKGGDGESFLKKEGGLICVLFHSQSHL